jgi:2-methylcitrate dehydratase PrpD
MEQTKRLAKFCKETKYEDLPPEVVKIAKQTMLDTIGCAIGTHSDEPEKPKIINKVVKEFKTPAEATVICGKFRRQPPLRPGQRGDLPRHRL